MDDRQKEIAGLKVERAHNHQQTSIVFGLGIAIGYLAGGEYYAPAITAVVIYVLFAYSVERRKKGKANGD